MKVDVTSQRHLRMSVIILPFLWFSHMHSQWAWIVHSLRLLRTVSTMSTCLGGTRKRVCGSNCCGSERVVYGDSEDGVVRAVRACWVFLSSSSSSLTWRGWCVLRRALGRCKVLSLSLLFLFSLLSLSSHLFSLCSLFLPCPCTEKNIFSRIN